VKKKKRSNGLGEPWNLSINMTLCLRLFILIMHKGLTERGMLDVPC